MKITAFIFTVLLFCQMAGLGSSQTLPADTNERRSYVCSGLIQRISPDQRLITIHHKSIPGFMPEMTMDFSVKDTNQLKGLSRGDELSFNLIVLQDDAWIENLHCTQHGKATVGGSPDASTTAESRLKPGDPWPDAELLDEHGRSIHFSDFRGQTVALDFFFTRCPLPAYCPRLNNNFAETRRLLSSAPGHQTNFLFLSISFDPDYDAPDGLAGYARRFRGDGDSNCWLFAVASRDTLARLPRALGLILQRQGAGITHNLRTVVLGPQGRVFRQFDGNEWTPQELAGAMEEAGRQTIKKGPK